jgi:hypothetical protein
MQGDDVQDMNVENLAETKWHRATQLKGSTRDLIRTWPPALWISALGSLLVAAAIGWKLGARRDSKATFNSKAQEN